MCVEFGEPTQQKQKEPGHSTGASAQAAPYVRGSNQYAYTHTSICKPQRMIWLRKISSIYPNRLHHLAHMEGLLTHNVTPLLRNMYRFWALLRCHHISHPGQPSYTAMKLQCEILNRDLGVSQARLRNPKKWWFTLASFQQGAH